MQLKSGLDPGMQKSTFTSIRIRFHNFIVWLPPNGTVYSHSLMPHKETHTHSPPHTYSPVAAIVCEAFLARVLFTNVETDLRDFATFMTLSSRMHTSVLHYDFQL